MTKHKPLPPENVCADFLNGDDPYDDGFNDAIALFRRDIENASLSKKSEKIVTKILESLG